MQTKRFTRSHRIPKKLREKILSRDNYRCTYPGCTFKPKDVSQLIIHHIDHDQFNDRPENLATTCRAHHQTLERGYQKALRRMSRLKIPLDKKFGNPQQQLLEC